MEPQLLTAGLFRGVWGTADDDLFAVGGSGLLAHYDGSRWTPFDPPDGFDRDFHGVFGFSSDDVYAVGDRGTIVHFDGSDWTRQETEGSLTRTLFAVWGSATDDIYASGESTIVHFDGSTWSAVDDAPAAGVDWRGISGSSENEILVAGEGGFFQTAHFLHYDGTNWNEIPVPAVGGNTYLNTVWASGVDEAFVGGVPGRVLQWNGSSLAEMVSGTNEALNGIWAATSSQAFAVGVRNTFIRYNGVSWTPVEFDLATDAVAAIYGFAGNDVIVAGRGVYHFDGANFDTVLPVSRPRGLWANSEDNALVLGATTLRYDGQRAFPEDFGGLSVPVLTAAWGPADHIVAVGADGSAYLYDGSSWGAMTTNNTETLTDVWGADTDAVFAVGAEGTILNFNGSAWGAMASGTDLRLTAVWGSAADDVFAVGAEGTILHYDGSSWSPMESGVDDTIFDIFGFGESEVYAGYAGGLLVWNGVTWSPRQVDLDGSPVSVNALSGTAPENMFISAGGRLAHYDGATATPLSELRMSAFIEAVGPRAVFAGSLSSFDERVSLYAVP